MTNKTVAIVDYGMGNIYSVRKALSYLGWDSVYTKDKNELLNSNHIILPGVGSFRYAVDLIKSSGLDEIINEYAVEKERPILGICLGMQLMGQSSTEGGETKGLGLFNGIVDKFPEGKMRVPHVGFNDVSIPDDSILYRGFDSSADFYFVHSFRMESEETERIGYCDYEGCRFVASYEKDNIFGTQFHPEKSQKNGLKLLENFLNI